METILPGISNSKGPGSRPLEKAPSSLSHRRPVIGHDCDFEMEGNSILWRPPLQKVPPYRSRYTIRDVQRVMHDLAFRLRAVASGKKQDGAYSAGIHPLDELAPIRPRFAYACGRKIPKLGIPWMVRWRFDPFLSWALTGVDGRLI